MSVGMKDLSVGTYAKTLQTMSLSGVGHFHDDFLEYERTGRWPCVGTDAEAECAGLDPMLERIFELESEIAMLQNYRTHFKLGKHLWNDRGFCEFCGWDGNA